MDSKLILTQTGKDPLYKIWHTNSRALFMYVYSGTGSVVTKDRNYPIEKNALILIAPGTYHYTMPDDPNSYIRSKLILSPAEFAGIADLLNTNKNIQKIFNRSVTYAPISSELHASVDQIFHDAAACINDADAPLLLSCALRLLHYLNMYATENTEATTGILSKAIQYINKNISCDLSLDSICSAINISKYHFCRQFKQQLGVTVMQYILRTRIVLAMDELWKTDTTISQISEKCGFSSVSYFCQVFKAATGCTPLQYRKRKID